MTYSPSDVKDVGTFVIRSSNIKDNILISADNVYVNPNIANSEPVKKDDVIMVVRNGSKSLIGKHALVTRKIDNTVIGAFMTGIRSSTPYFLDALLDTINFKKEIYKNLGATINQITIGNLRKMTFKVPNESEKFKIGSLFKKLNYLLALYENKRKLLTALSQGLSQYLFNFSKEKNAIQMSLSSITLSEAKGIAKENTLSSGNIEYLDTTRLNGGKAKLVSGKKDVDFQDIIVLWDGSNAGKIYYGFSGILGSTLKVFKLKGDINSEYVYYYLKFKQNLILHKFRTPNIPHVSKDFSQRFNLPIPDKEKQNLIANILHLNELQINLTNKKIKKLKQIKKSLLQNMFL